MDAGGAARGGEVTAVAGPLVGVPRGPAGRLGTVSWVVALVGMVLVPGVLVAVALVRSAWLGDAPPSPADLRVASDALTAACWVDGTATVVTAALGVALTRRHRHGRLAWLHTAWGAVVLPVLLLMAVSPPS